MNGTLSKRPRHGPVGRKAVRRRAAVAFAGLCSAAALVAPLAPTAAHATAASVSGEAYGFITDISLFGAHQPVHGPTPDVVLPTGGSLVPMTAQVPTGTSAYGPATLYSSGPIAVTTDGKLSDPLNGNKGYVKSSSTATNVGTWLGVTIEDTGYEHGLNTYVQPLGGEMDPFIALEVHSECSVTEGSTPTGSVTIRNGRTVSKNSNNEPYDEHLAPESPTAYSTSNTTDGFTTGVLAQVGDSWKIRYNEQKLSPDGKTLEVWAVHLYLLGPNAVGDMWIGYSKCGYA